MQMKSFNKTEKKKPVLSIYMCIIVALMSFTCLINGCQQAKSPVTKSGLYFDTVISITLYEKNSSKLIDQCFNMASDYEALLSKTVANSDVSRINKSAPVKGSSESDYVKISPETLYLIQKAFEYEDLSQGKFSVMCGALTDLWDINDMAKDKSSYNIPDSSDIESAIKLCGKGTLDIDESNCAVRINTPGASLDLGAVAKGYIADKMKEYLVSKGVNSGIIQLGGNVLLIGENPTKDNGLYSIGITKPFTSDDVISVVTAKDVSVVTSGNYQRYFEYEGKIYHHIIDLTTGFPADTGLNSTTVICSSSTDADILSTVTFLLGEKEGLELIDSLNSGQDNYKIVIVDSGNNILHNYE